MTGVCPGRRDKHKKAKCMSVLSSVVSLCHIKMDSQRWECEWWNGNATDFFAQQSLWHMSWLLLVTTTLLLCMRISFFKTMHLFLNNSTVLLLKQLGMVHHIAYAQDNRQTHHHCLCLNYYMHFWTETINGSRIEEKSNVCYTFNIEELVKTSQSSGALKRLNLIEDTSEWDSYGVRLQTACCCNTLKLWKGQAGLLGQKRNTCHCHECWHGKSE